MENNQNSKEDKEWNLKNVISISLAVLAGISPLLIFGFTFYLEVKKYVHTIEMEQKFRVDEQVTELFKLLHEKDPEQQRIAAVSLSSYGEPALTFLIEYLDSGKHTKVYNAILKSIRIIINDSKTESEREKRINKAWLELIPVFEQNVADLDKPKSVINVEKMSAQFKTLYTLANMPKSSRQTKLCQLNVFWEKISKFTSAGEHQLAVKLMNAIKEENIDFSNIKCGS